MSSSQENICTEWRRSTPLKSTDPVPVLLIGRLGATPDLAHITPIKQSTLVEPWTPTANLKMLISAASPDIRDREMKKVLFRPIENEKDEPASPDAVAEDTEVEDSCQVCEMGHLTCILYNLKSKWFQKVSDILNKTSKQFSAWF